MNDYLRTSFKSNDSSELKKSFINDREYLRKFSKLSPPLGMTTKLIKARTNNRNRYFWSGYFMTGIISKFEYI